MSPLADSLADAVRRVLTCVATKSQPFGVFVLSGKVVLSDSSGPRFSSLIRCRSAGFVGTYDRHVDVRELLDDLTPFFGEGGR